MNLLNEKQTAVALGLSVAALRKWRHEGRGPAYFRVGRLVRYSMIDLEHFLAGQRVEASFVNVGAEEFHDENV